MAKKPPKFKVVKDTNIIQLNAFDPDCVNQRLYKQISMLLGQLEEKDSRSKVTIRERIAALVAVGRIQQIFIAMRKATGDVGAGSTVKKFAAAFSSDATGRGTKATGRGRSDPEPEDWFDKYPGSTASDDDDDGDAA